MRKVKQFPLLLCLGVGILIKPPFANATAIIRVVDPASFILVAADSVQVKASTGKKAETLSTCKIVKIDDNLFWAATGLHRSDTFNSLTIFRDAYKNGTML
jgi:hypothetical protein